MNNDLASSKVSSALFVNCESFNHSSKNLAMVTTKLFVIQNIIIALRSPHQENMHCL